MQTQSVVQLSAIDKSYRLGRVAVPALSEVSLDVARGDFLALAGPSGSGKTTLLNLIGCVDKPDRGRVVIDGIDVTAIPLHRLAETRRDVLGFVFQTFNLLPVLTAWENVEYPLLLRGIARGERRERVERWLELTGIAAQARQRPDQLSGGQRQRVAIARAMAGDPKLVIADEPTANLDSETGTRILDLLADINRTTGCTFVFSTHDAALIARAARVVRIRDGRVDQRAEGRRQKKPPPCLISPLLLPLPSALCPLPSKETP
jgi:putative ABC transport system ATP-binding protein